MLTFVYSRLPMAFDAMMAGPTPIRVLRADMTIVSGITKLMAERALLPTKCPIMMASTVTVSCMAPDDNNDAQR